MLSCEQCGNTGTIYQTYYNRKVVYLCQICFSDWQQPKIVCLCGSTKFYQDFERIRFEETLAGKIVLTIGCDTKQDNDLKFTEEQKRDLDRLHMWKIKLANEVIIINRNGYIGESTQRELNMAIKLEKSIRYAFPQEA